MGVLAPAALGLLFATAPATASAATPSVYVATTGSDTGACTQTAPCKSFDRAYRVAKSGQVVEVAAGTYPGQTVFVDPTKTTSTDVVFRPAAGASVVLTGLLSIYGKHIEFADLKLRGGWTARSGSVDLTFRNISASTFSIQSSWLVSILGGEVGPWTATSEADPKISKSSASNPGVPGQITIDGVRFHDIVRPPGSPYHIECLQVGSVAGLAIRNSVFDNCATQAILVSSWGPTYHLSAIVIENNSFERVVGYHSVTLSIVSPGQPCSSCVIRNNTALLPIATNVTRTARASRCPETACRMPTSRLPGGATTARTESRGRTTGSRASRRAVRTRRSAPD